MLAITSERGPWLTPVLHREPSLSGRKSGDFFAMTLGVSGPYSWATLRIRDDIDQQ